MAVPAVPQAKTLRITLACSVLFILHIQQISGALPLQLSSSSHLYRVHRRHPGPSPHLPTRISAAASQLPTLLLPFSSPASPPPSPFSSSGTLFKCKSDHVRRVTFFKGYFQTHRGGLFSAKVEPKAISKITTYHMISPHTPLCLNFLPHSLPFTPFEPHSPLLVFPFTDQVSFASRPCTCCCFCLDVLPLGISLACRESS